MFQKSVALVPAYKPDSRIFSVVESLKKYGFKNILAVSDGNSAEYEPILSVLDADPDVTLLRHSVNMGKGRAMKTAFDYILKSWPEHSAVCVDCDGQLGADDAAKAADLAEKHPDSLILGYRDLGKTENVPAASLFGNFTTRITVCLLTGIRFADTQCGLRAYPPAVMKKLLAVSGERFEFENNTLTEARKSSIPVVEFPINVVYEANEGYTTTFRRVRDSIIIYKNLLSFFCAPAITFLLASVLWLLITNSLSSPSAVGISFVLAEVLAASLCTLVTPKVKPLILSSLLPGIVLGAAAFGLTLAGLGNGLVWLCLLIPAFWGLTFIYRRFGFGPKAKVLRLKQ